MRNTESSLIFLIKILNSNHKLTLYQLGSKYNIHTNVYSVPYFLICVFTLFICGKMEYLSKNTISPIVI